MTRGEEIVGAWRVDRCVYDFVLDNGSLSENDLADLARRIDEALDDAEISEAHWRGEYLALIERCAGVAENAGSSDGGHSIAAAIRALAEEKP